MDRNFSGRKRGKKKKKIEFLVFSVDEDDDGATR